ncbi:MAG: YihY/virulence factor BrkB family protein [Paracoccaceae bacterium]
MPRSGSASPDRPLLRKERKLAEPGRIRIGKLIAAVWQRSDERHIGLIAAGVAFYALFAIFPGMAALIAIWGFFAEPLVMRDYLSQLHEVIPEAAYGLLETQMNALLAANTSTLGWATFLSLSLALYSVHNGVAALVSGLNAIHGRSPRPGYLRLLRSFLMTLTLLLLALLTLATVIVLPLAVHLLPLGYVEGFLLSYLPWAVTFVLVLAVLGLFYRWGPNVEGARYPWLTPGALFAAVLWAGSSLALSAYLANFNAYNRVYGSIGAVIALLTWFYISAYIVLLGAILNAEAARLECQ